jgi:hypothetical protein
MIARCLLAGAACLMLVGRADAQPATSSAAKPAVAAAPQPEGEAWVANVAKWMQPIASVSQRQSVVVIALLGGGNTARGYLTKKASKDGAVWAESWSKARAIELDTLQSDSNALTQDLPPISPALANDPTVQSLQTSLSGYRRAVRTNTDQLVAMSRQVLGLISAMAGGDETAAAEFARRAGQLTIAMLSAEVANVQAGTAFLRSGDPERDVATCNIEGDLALITILQARADGVLSSGRAATAAQARQHARAALAAAEQMTLDAQSQLVRVKSAGAGQLTPEFIERVTRSLATYTESAEIERQIAQVLLIGADHVEKGDIETSPEVQKAMASLSPLVQRRVALDMQRNRIMAGQG